MNLFLKLSIVLTILAHGLIHILGFLKAWDLAEVKQLTGQTTIALSGQSVKIIGIFWLIGLLVFLVSAVGLTLNKDWWWMTAGLGLMLSQILIIIYWHDAKFGTVANLIILVAVALTYAHWNLNREFIAEAKTLVAQSTGNQGAIVNKEMLAGLPTPVQRHLTYAGVIGQPIIETVRLKQIGKIRQSPDQAWKNLTAQQYYTVNPPGFIWRGEISAVGLPFIQARDSYLDGKGRMFIRMLALKTIADAKGAEMDQGAMMRYLNEMMWFPTAYLNKNISWKAIDDNSAEIRLTHHGQNASAVLRFDAQGKITNFIAQRYRTINDKYELASWSTPMSGYGEFQGLKLPSQGKAVWILAEGDFDYIELTITGIEYNIRKPD